MTGFQGLVVASVGISVPLLGCVLRGLSRRRLDDSEHEVARFRFDRGGLLGVSVRHVSVALQ